MFGNTRQQREVSGEKYHCHFLILPDLRLFPSPCPPVHGELQDRRGQVVAERGPEPEADADLVIYNYVNRSQEPGIERAAKVGKGVLIMKVLGGQYLSWQDKMQTDWTEATAETLVQLSPLGESMRHELDLVYSFTAGPWSELLGQDNSPTGQALAWVLKNENVSSTLVAVASVAELDAVLGG